MRTIHIALAAVFALSHSAARAECAYPQAPSAVPDGKKASEAEMLEAMNAYQKYNDEVTAYVACLDTETKARLQQGGTSSQLIMMKSLQLKRQNAAVDELRNNTQLFNEQVKAYKRNR